MEEALAITKRTATESRSSILSSCGASRWRAMSALTTGLSSGECRYSELKRTTGFWFLKLLDNFEIVMRLTNCYPRSG